ARPPRKDRRNPMTNDPIRALVDAHERLAAANEQSLEPMSDEDLASFSDRGYVKYPLSESHVQELETLAGFAFSPLLKRLLQPPGAMPPFDVGVFGINGWAGHGIFEKNREIAEAREKYHWELPKLLVISSDEDFRAVTEAGDVVRVCSN